MNSAANLVYRFGSRPPPPTQTHTHTHTNTHIHTHCLTTLAITNLRRLDGDGSMVVWNYAANFPPATLGSAYTGYSPADQIDSNRRPMGRDSGDDRIIAFIRTHYCPRTGMRARGRPSTRRALGWTLDSTAHTTFVSLYNPQTDRTTEGTDY